MATNGNNALHGGIPIGAVQLVGIHAQKFNDLINQSVDKQGRTGLSYRGVQPFIGPRNIDDQHPSSSSLLLLHVPPMVAAALDDGNPALMEFLKQNNGYYLPGVRRSRMDRAATRRKRGANIKEPIKTKSTDNDEVLAAAAASASEITPAPAAFTFSELFAGIGGFRLGLEAIGGRCVFANEMDPYASSIYRRNFIDSDGTTLIEADILDLCAVRDIPADIDILTGGFPCQPFSSRGKQPRGLQDERGQLYREIVRVLRASHPKSFILENVSGLVRSGIGGGGRYQGRGQPKTRGEAGSVFQTILSAFEDCGYTVDWNICNACHYVAQHRERVFIVGIRNDLGVDKNKYFSWDWYDKMLLDGQQPEEQPEADTMSKMVVRDIMEPPDSLAVLNSELSTKQWTKLQELHSNKINGSIEAACSIDINAKAPTLISSYRSSGANQISKYIFVERDGTRRKVPRFLTPRECCRIQGFPEDFHAPSIDGDSEVMTAHFYAGIGNAVVPSLVASISTELVRCLHCLESCLPIDTNHA